MKYIKLTFIYFILQCWNYALMPLFATKKDDEISSSGENQRIKTKIGKQATDRHFSDLSLSTDRPTNGIRSKTTTATDR